MSIRYREPANVDYGDYDPEGNRVNGFATEPVAKDGTFGQAILNLVRAESGNHGYPDVLMTTREHWSGYSTKEVTE